MFKHTRLLLILLVSLVVGAGDESPQVVCVSETNRYRSMNGKADVVRAAKLEEYATAGARIDFDSQPHQHFSRTQGGGIAFAENECPHWNLNQTKGDMAKLVQQCVARFYEEGPGSGVAHGHYMNMMGEYRALGCGIYKSGNDVTIVQDYGE